MMQIGYNYTRWTVRSIVSGSGEDEFSLPLEKGAEASHFQWLGDRPRQPLPLRGLCLPIIQGTSASTRPGLSLGSEGKLKT